MTSNALSDWRTVLRLDQLFAIVGPTKRLDLIEALVMRLAAEWQGFLRQFRDEITELFIAQCGLLGAPAQITHNLITYRRELQHPAYPKSRGTASEPGYPELDAFPSR